MTIHFDANSSNTSSHDDFSVLIRNEPSRFCEKAVITI